MRRIFTAIVLVLAVAGLLPLVGRASPPVPFQVSRAYLPLIRNDAPPTATATPTAEPTATATTEPTATATSAPLPTATATTGPACDPAYPTVCIPPPPPDLNCGDIPHRRFVVLAPDPHKFDTDGDGIGCES